MKLLYGLLLLNCFFNAIVRQSGLFYESTARMLIKLYNIILMSLLLVGAIKFSWLHIIYMIATDFFSYFIFALIVKKLFVKR